MRKSLNMATIVATICANSAVVHARRRLVVHCKFNTVPAAYLHAPPPPPSLSSSLLINYCLVHYPVKKCQPSLPFTTRRCELHSTALLMASKRNGGKSKKARLTSTCKTRTMPDSEDDDGAVELTSFVVGENYTEEENIMASDFIATFASEYHAPVMPTECVNALLQQGEWGDILRARKERWRKKRSIILAKERRSLLYDDNDGDDDDDIKNIEEDVKCGTDSDYFKQTGVNDVLSQSDTLAVATHDPKKHPRLFIDGTLGGGGHSQALLQQLNAGDILIGCDVDPEALSTASIRLSEYLATCEYILETNNFTKPECGWNPERPMFIPVQSNFRNLVSILSKIRHPVTSKFLLGDRRQNGINGTIKKDDNSEVEFPHGANGMLLDLGVSSHQINTSERGFAFMKEGPLDMRMSGNTQSSGLTAADICNEFDESTIVDILRTYGDEPRAKRIASAIVTSRPLFTTTDLVHAINSVTPTFARQKRAGLIATSARVFQALRIVVNEEDTALKEVLERVAPWVLARSRTYHLGSTGIDDKTDESILAVLSYHSMEDKMAKRVMRDGKVDIIQDGYIRRGGGGALERDLWGNRDEITNDNRPFEPLTKPRSASDEEVAANSRSRSAVLRVAVRI